MMENFDRFFTDRRISLPAVESFISGSDDPKDRLFGEHMVIRHLRHFGYRQLFCPFAGPIGPWGRLLECVFGRLSLKRRRMAFYGVIGGHYGGAAHMAESNRGIAKLRFITKAFDVRDPIGHTIVGLNRFLPDTLSGYPSSLTILADSQLSGDLRISPRFVASGGEPLTNSDRDIINRAFGASILNVYGTSEHLTMGVGRPEDGGIYLFEDELVFEIEKDRVLVTNLFKYTQPMIRYVLDDQLEKLDDPHARATVHKDLRTLLVGPTRIQFSPIGKARTRS